MTTKKSDLSNLYDKKDFWFIVGLFLVLAALGATIHYMG